MTYLIKETEVGCFEIWQEVIKTKLTFKGFKKYLAFEKKPFYNWVLWNSKLYNNNFNSIIEAKEFLNALKEFENYQYKEELVEI